MLILTLVLRELRSLFLSPRAWAVLAVVQLILGYLFLVYVDSFTEVQPRLAGTEGAPGLTDIVISPLFATASFVLLLVIPVLTMGLISEERHNQTLSLLFSAPLSMTEIILGKYLAILAFLLIMLAMITLMPLSLLLGGTIDLGQFSSGLLALALLLASFTALGLFISTLTQQPTVAAVTTFGILLLLWVLDWAGKTDIPYVSGPLGYLSMLGHYAALLKGVFNSSDVIYYLLFIITFLVLAIRRLDADRLQR